MWLWHVVLVVRYVSLTCTGLFTAPPPPVQSHPPVSEQSALPDGRSGRGQLLPLLHDIGETSRDDHRRTTPTPSSNRPTTPLPTTARDVQVRIRLHFWHAHLIQCQSCSVNSHGPVTCYVPHTDVGHVMHCYLMMYIILSVEIAASNVSSRLVSTAFKVWILCWWLLSTYYTMLVVTY